MACEIRNRILKITLAKARVILNPVTHCLNSICYIHLFEIPYLINTLLIVKMTDVKVVGVVKQLLHGISSFASGNSQYLGGK